MRYASINKCDAGNGPGIRVSFWVQGCPLHCPGCQNESIWDFNGGTKFTKETIDNIIKLCEPEYIEGLSILGGEPFANEDNLYNLLFLCSIFKEKYPNKTIWIWTGYTYNDLITKFLASYAKPLADLVKKIDVLVDGPYIAAKRNITDANQYRGSENQRVIDIKKTLKKGEVVLYE